MTELYSEWRDFYAKRVSSWMSLEELRAECGRLQTVDSPSPEVLLIHAMHALEEMDALARENEALKRCAIKYLGWLGVTHIPLDQALHDDMRNPSMCGDVALSKENINDGHHRTPTHRITA